MLPSARCALTAPFHPYRPLYSGVGGLLSVALAVGLHPPGVTWHLTLWSPDFPPLGLLQAATVWRTFRRQDSRHTRELQVNFAYRAIQ